MRFLKYFLGVNDLFFAIIFLSLNLCNDHINFRSVSKFGGRAFFITGIFFCAIDGYYAYQNDDDEGLYMAGVDIAINTVLFCCGVGILGIPAFYLLKEMFRPINLQSRPFNPDDLGKPYYHKPDNLRIDRPLFIP